jgi:hypothetical protein
MVKSLLAAAALTGMAISFAAVPASAARYCVGENCNFSSRASCERLAARTGDDCERYRGQRGGLQGSRFDSRDQLEPSRPYGANRNQCYFDDGGGRFRPCEQPSGGRS